MCQSTVLTKTLLNETLIGGVVWKKGHPTSSAGFDGKHVFLYSDAGLNYAFAEYVTVQTAAL